VVRNAAFEGGEGAPLFWGTITMPLPSLNLYNNGDPPQHGEVSQRTTASQP